MGHALTCAAAVANRSNRCCSNNRSSQDVRYLHISSTSLDPNNHIIEHYQFMTYVKSSWDECALSIFIRFSGWSTQLPQLDMSHQICGKRRERVSGGAPSAGAGCATRPRLGDGEEFKWATKRNQPVRRADDDGFGVRGAQRGTLTHGKSENTSYHYFLEIEIVEPIERKAQLACPAYRVFYMDREYFIINFLVNNCNASCHGLLYVVM